MTNDQFQTLVDGAARAVNNLIPESSLRRMGDNARSALLASLNDGLTATLCAAMDRSADRSANPTRARTIAAMIYELIETHIAKCDDAGNGATDRPPHVISQAHGTKAVIDSIASCDVEAATQIYLVLDDGAAFRITVEAIEP